MNDSLNPRSRLPMRSATAQIPVETLPVTRNHGRKIVTVTHEMTE